MDWEKKEGILLTPGNRMMRNGGERVQIRERVKKTVRVMRSV